MTDELLEKVKEFFSTRTIPGTSYEFKEHGEYTVNLTANLIIDDDYDRATIVDYVEDYVKNTFFAYGNLKFGDTFAKSELESQVRETFAGVESFRITSPDSDIIASNDESKIIVLGTLTLNVTGGKVKEG